MTYPTYKVAIDSDSADRVVADVLRQEIKSWRQFGKKDEYYARLAAAAKIVLEHFT